MLAARRLFVFPLVFAGLVLATAADAQPPTEDRPATWDMSLEELQAIGLGQSRGDPVPVPPDAPLHNAPDDPERVKQGVIFVNYDGETLSSGYDDSHTNTTQIGQLAGQFAAYGAGPKREASLQAVMQDWEAYDVIVTDSRPGSGDYTMNMTGPTNPFGGGVLGIAPLDCNDSQTHNNITYAFHDANDFASASIQATTIGQEVAHSYGLEHVNEPGDIMNPYNAGGDPSFRDECIPLSQGGQCASQHNAHCGGGAQNSHQELLTLFGPSAPDMGPPTVTVTYPNDGDNFEPGANFEITADASDDRDIAEAQLWINGAQQGAMPCTACSWGVTNIPEGNYEVHVIAVDTAMNEAMSNVVNFTVGAAGGDGGGDGAGDDGGTGGDDGGAGDDGGDGDLGGENRKDGCGCASAPAPAGSLVLLIGLALMRRRRVQR